MINQPGFKADTPVPRLVLAGVLAILTITVLRCTTVYDDFPAWSSDPLQLPVPIVGVTPAISMALDLLTILACTLCLIGAKLTSIPRSWIAFLAIGCASVVYHIFTPSGGSLEDSLAGLHLTASLASAVAVAAASYHARIRMLILSVLCAVVVLLAFKGVSNYFIEQPEMAQMFAQEKDRYIAAQGWTPGSGNALAYERRLTQREATGWFGLSNVFASVTGAGLAIFFSLLLPTLWRRTLFPTSLRTRLGLTLCTILAVMSLLLAGSKGGTAAACIGIVFAFVGTWACLSALPNKPTRSIILLATRTLGLIVPLMVLVAVALRGFIGERLGELSILFRWFYIEAAARIFAHNPLFGVGPAGFKDAYMLLKNPLSPEDVISPHSIFFDLFATLGFGGVTFGGVLVALFLGAGKSLFPQSTLSTGHDTLAKTDSTVEDESADSEQSPLRLDLRLALAPTVVGVLASAWLEQQVATPASTLVRLGGLFIGGLAAAIISQYSRQYRGLEAMSVAAASGAFVIIAHSQIEMTLTTSGASLWACVLLGLAASPALWLCVDRNGEPLASTHDSGEQLHRVARITRWLTSLVLMSFVITCMFPWLRTWQWESNLRAAANAVAPSTQFQLRAAALTASPQSPIGDSFEFLFRDVEDAAGSKIPRSGQALSDALFHLRVSSTKVAFNHLEAAAHVWPTHLATSRTASRVAIANFQLASTPTPGASTSPTPPPPPLATEYFDKAVTLASDLTINAPSSPAYSWLATLLEESYRQSPATATFEKLAHALKNATVLAPYEPINFQRLARLFATKDPQVAAEYAQTALKLNANLRLDPLRQFSDSDRAELEALIVTLK